MSGQIDASDEHTAAAYIRELGHLPMRIRQARGQSVDVGQAGSFVARHFVYPFWTGINISQLLYFYQQLSTLLGSGMSLSESLRSLSSRTRGKLGRIVLEARDTVVQGGQLSEVMSRHPHVFNLLQLSLVRAGEAGGLLDQMIERIAKYLEHEIKIRRMIARMMLYPIVIIIFAVLAYVCVPHLATAVLKGMGPFISAVWPTLRSIALCLVGIVLVLKFVFQFRAARFMWDGVKTLPPIVGAVGRKIAMSRFARALSVLYSAGLPLDHAVQVAADACANLVIANGMKRAIPGVRSGEGLTASLERTGAIMPMVLDMLATGEKTGSLDLSLTKVADYLDDEAETTIHKLGIALFVTMILIAGVVVGLVVIQFYTGAVNKTLGGM